MFLRETSNDGKNYKENSKFLNKIDCKEIKYNWIVHALQCT